MHIHKSVYAYRCRDGLVSKTQHIQEGFHRLFCLVPYDIISAELWNHIMPNWMEAILQDVPEEELPELKIILRWDVCRRRRWRAHRSLVGRGIRSPPTEQNRRR